MDLREFQKAKDPNTPKEELFALVQKDKRLALHVAENPSAPPNLLEMIFQKGGTVIKKALAKNPNTPIHLLLELAKIVPDCFFQNPAIPLLLLGEPLLFTKLPTDVARLLVKKGNPPKEFFSHFASHSSFEVRLLISRHPKIPLEILQNLANDTAYLVPIDIATRNTHKEILEALAEHKEVKVRQALTKNPNLPDKLFEKLSRDPQSSVRGFLALRQELSFSIFETLANDPDKNVRYRIALHSKLPEHLFVKLTNDKEDRVQEGIAQNPKTSQKLLKELSRKKTNLFRIELLARHKNTPEEVLGSLAKGTSEITLFHLANNAKTPPKILEEIAEHPKAWIRAASQRNPNTPKEIVTQIKCLETQSVSSKQPVLEPLLQSEELRTLVKRGPFIKALVAEHANTPLDLLETLSKDASVLVQTGLAKNPNTPGKILQEILDRSYTRFPEKPDGKRFTSHIEESSLRKLLLMHPNVPASVVTNLAGEANYQLKIKALLHPKASEELRKKFIKNEEEITQLARSLSIETLNNYLIHWDLTKPIFEKLFEKLAKIQNTLTQKAILDHPKVPHDILETLANSSKEEIKAKAICHPNLPFSLLQKLAKKDELLRYIWTHPLGHKIPVKNLSIQQQELRSKTLAKNPYTPITLLKEFAKSESPAIRVGLAKHSKATLNILEVLQKDVLPSIRTEVAKHPNTSTKILSYLLEDSSPRVRKIAANNKKAPEEKIKFLIKAGASKDLENISHHWKLPYKTDSTKESLQKQWQQIQENRPDILSKEELETLSKGGPFARMLLTTQPRLTNDLFQTLSQDPVKTVRVMLAQHPGLPEAWQSFLTKDQKVQVRKAIAAHPFVSETLLFLLADDESHNVRREVARNINTPQRLLEVLSNEDQLEILICLAQNPKTPDDILQKIVTRHERILRAANHKIHRIK